MTAAPAIAQSTGIDIQGLSISYLRRRQPLRVIDDVSLRILPGEAYGLVGESGCGKTTIAMALMRYLPDNAVVEAGRIMYGGADVLALPESELRRLRGDRIAMVYQDPGSALNPSMRIGDQVAEVFLAHRELDKRAARDAAREMLERVRIADADAVLRRYPHQVSGGQQQRVVIAMALATNPDLLVLDEPTTALDATVEAEVLDLVEQLRSEFGTAILFISHNLGIVARICERVGVLYAGRLIEEGPARELFSHPRHPYTSALLRSLPRAGTRKDVLSIQPIPGSLPPLGADIPGCAYADRCPLAIDRCREEPPPLEPLGRERSSRCFRHDDVPRIPVVAPPVAAARAEATAEPLLDIQDLVVTYGSGRTEMTAVAGISLAVGRGEVLGLVGESGSGKTSLAKSVVGLVESSAGTVVFDGDELTRAARRDPALRRNLQMVFQNPDSALNQRHSVRRILGRALRLLERRRARGAEAERHLVELAASVKLEPRHLDVRPSALSGGLKQRVAIARSFAGSPSLVVCDEPASALDVSIQAAILNLLVELQRTRGTSYIFISHDLSVVRYVADRIGVMYLGQLIDVGTTDEVFNPPHHPYTEALVSAIPSLDPDAAPRRVKLEGAMPSPSNPPTGCRFHTRCPRSLGEICATEAPPWQADGERRAYRCHIPPDELGALQRADAKR